MTTVAVTTAAVEIRVRGRVQGVGFRPVVWRLARELGLTGDVRNDSGGVLIRAGGPNAAIDAFVARLRGDPPPLARIEAIETRAMACDWPAEFRIAASAPGDVRTEVAPDARVCPSCAAEIVDPFERRFRYPFAACTECGPRFSVVRAVPYDRAATSMAPFALCPSCGHEYDAPADRRFHAEAMACHTCGPRARLVRTDGAAFTFDRHSPLDEVDAVGGLLLKGEIVAIKGLGGYQLACDATNAETVANLRARKQRDAKPFALMARDLDVIRRYCAPTDAEIALLQSAAAPIVIMRATAELPDAIAHGLSTIGFMLPTTPLHVLALKRMDRPVVMTSGNLHDEPQFIDDDAALAGLRDIADYALIHDRAIVNRVDDSVVRVIAGRPTVLRRARGYAPGALTLPDGFADAPEILAYGGELKATFCLVHGGQAILSQHIGDLENAPTLAAYEEAQGRYAALFDHRPAVLAVDMHPDYLSTKLARARGLPVVEVQHHHAHVAACLAENGRARDAAPVLGIVLDGLGWGDDGALWGGEFLLADYRGLQRLATFKPVALLGGAQAMREPWRNLYAHLTAEMGWAEIEMNFGELPLYRFLAAQPLKTLDAMRRTGINAPLASSCGRLFDAVAAALDLCCEKQAYEGEAAMRLEAIVDAHALAEEDDTLAYPFTIPHLAAGGMPYIEPRSVWNAILGDLILGTPAPVIAARFHKGLAKALAAMAVKLAVTENARTRRFDTVALTGGCFQNAVLARETRKRLEAARFAVLMHGEIPPGDGGLALGQAAVAAAREIAAGRS